MSRWRAQEITALGLLAACAGGEPSGPATSFREGLLVSDAAPLRDSTETPSPGTYAFVSLRPGTIPDLTTATVRNLSTGVTTTVSVVDGGVDPMPVPASTGDTVELTGIDGSGDEHEFGSPVKARVPPVVVRSEPGRGATDAPTLLRIGVTFSEPVAVPTVTTGTVQVLLRNQLVAGTVVLSADGLRAQFVPEDSLVAGATYTVVITRGVEDRTGDRLSDEYRYEFTVAPYTGPTIAFASVATGWEFSCATARSGAVYCWGQGDEGQLGIAPSRHRRRPSLVTLPGPAVEVDVGVQAACALTISREPLCWGTMASVLPSNSVHDPDTAYATPLPLLGTDPVRHLALGGGEICAINDQGELICRHNFTPEPQVWLYAPSLAQISVGWDHNCYVTAARVAYCYGENDYGKLGTGTTEPMQDLVPVVGDLEFTAVTTGLHSSCGLVDGRAYCWGWNAQGGLGTGIEDEVYVPTPVAGDLRFALIDAGYYHTCGLTTDGTAYCWGDNRAGQLGDGTRTQRNAPVPVQGGFEFRTLSASTDHTCAITLDDVLYCWGGNRFGQLGDGSTASAPYPIRAAYQR